MKDKFLPIGTVVLLNGGNKELMITGYCITKKELEDKVEAINDMFDYGACRYPEGIMNSELTYAFNHDQIKEVLFEGFITEKSKDMSKLLNGGLEIYKKKLENRE